jgi:hypothetical protein
MPGAKHLRKDSRSTWHKTRLIPAQISGRRRHDQPQSDIYLDCRNSKSMRICVCCIHDYCQQVRLCASACVKHSSHWSCDESVFVRRSLSCVLTQVHMTVSPFVHMTKESLNYRLFVHMSAYEQKQKVCDSKTPLS